VSIENPFVENEVTRVYDLTYTAMVFSNHLQGADRLVHVKAKMNPTPAQIIISFIETMDEDGIEDSRVSDIAWSTGPERYLCQPSAKYLDSLEPSADPAVTRLTFNPIIVDTQDRMEKLYVMSIGNIGKQEFDIHMLYSEKLQSLAFYVNYRLGSC
jgi:hypothetical protein